MIKRCIMIFPEFNNIEKIEGIRREYDPLVKHVRPYITLVFPFLSGIETAALKKHIEKATFNIQPFKLKLTGVTGESNHFGNYLFLNVQEGENEIIQLNNSLYTGILAEFHYEYMKKNGYTPHLTVGNLHEKAEFRQAVESLSGFNEVFETMVNNVSVEIIDENDDSIIEMHLPLHD
jgi:2'-5' RNA ligase